MMQNETDFSAIAVNNTIQLFFKEEGVNIQKDQNPDLFERIFKLLKEGKTEQIKRDFFEIKEELERYTKGKFHIGTDGNMYLKGDDEPIPALVAKKLKQLRDAELEFMPLVRFWKKLKKNPDKNVRAQLYGFLHHNHIPITLLGDIICEKGVKETKGGTLVDVHTGKIDNSVGMTVEVPRSEVDSDPNRTCSHGLHVGAPDYVRKHWNSDVIVEVEVDPSDFVAIPSDYDETKARVCRYKVIGIAKKNPRNELIYNFDDVIAPTHEALHEQKKRGKTDDDNSTSAIKGLDYNKMTAKAIIDYVRKETGIRITTDVKNKKSVIKKAEKILSGTSDLGSSTIVLTGKTAKEIIDIIKQNTGIVISVKKPWRKEIVKRAEKIFKSRGCKIVD